MSTPNPGDGRVYNFAALREELDLVAGKEIATVKALHNARNAATTSNSGWRETINKNAPKMRRAC